MRIINLLPKTKQLELKYEDVARSIGSLIALSIVSFVVVVAGQFGSRLFLAAEQRKVESRIGELTVQVNKQENAKIKTKIQGINNTIVDFRTLSAAAPKWSQMVRALAPLVPESVSVQSLSVDSVKKTVSISGFSPTREAVIQLHDNIAADTAHFSNVDYPLENVAKPTNVSFHFSFTVSDQTIK